MPRRTWWLTWLALRVLQGRLGEAEALITGFDNDLDCAPPAAALDLALGRPARGGRLAGRPRRPRGYARFSLAARAQLVDAALQAGDAACSCTGRLRGVSRTSPPRQGPHFTARTATTPPARSRLLEAKAKPRLLRLAAWGMTPLEIVPVNASAVPPRSVTVQPVMSMSAAVTLASETESRPLTPPTGSGGAATMTMSTAV